MDERLLDDLEALSESDMCPMHMPGHKRRVDALGDTLPYALDITEIDGFDDLHSRLWDSSETGSLHTIASVAATLYDCPTAFPLVGGSTVGILAAVRALATVSHTSEILMARNCHKSVYHAVEINHLTPQYLCPTIGEGGIAGAVRPAEVERFLKENPACRVVVLTSPTYEGVISPVAEIAQVVHDHGGYLLVDGAHGAHLPFTEGNNPFKGADITVVSLHKTLPALTQTALLLVGSERVAPWRVAREIGVFETSSPSYPLIASIQECLRWIVEHRCEFDRYTAAVVEARSALTAMEHLHLFVPDGLYDAGKIVIRTDSSTLTGRELCERLRYEHHIELEMASLDYAIAMTSVCDAIPVRDGQTPLARLVEALLAVDKDLQGRKLPVNSLCLRVPERAMAAQDALISWDGQTYATQSELQGRIAACYVWAYPPGVPLIVPGERFDDVAIATLDAYSRAGISVRCVGGDGCLPERVPVLCE